MTRRVLVLSASVGAGHMRAAEAVELALRQVDPTAEIQNVDAQIGQIMTAMASSRAENNPPAPLPAPPATTFRIPVFFFMFIIISRAWILRIIGYRPAR